ncbi:hypothetical protein BGZ60DRAFT_532487 [Tricladium varicosporioides]|nr:hypothetical protein BGZ60DRAFT_532487 [Hymenoscyphus varicosporioides]
MPPSLEGPDYHDNTIIVKGEYGFSRPSSPESMSPELEPLVNHLLAQINTTQHLESPEPLEEDMLPSHMNHNPYPPARLDPPSQRVPKSRPRPNALTMEERLQQMPERRTLNSTWRPGVEPGAENETGGESRRKQIRFGCLLVTRGEIQAVPCNSCANGRGKFNVCVALEGFFKGACASCQLSGRPNRCSIKVNDDVAESSPLNTPGGGVPLNNIQPARTPQPLSEGPKTKRQKTDIVPEWESQRPQWEQELGDSHARQQMKDIVQRPWATVNPQLSTQTTSMMMNGGNSGNRSVPASAIEQQTPMSASMENPLGWASVNQQSPVPGAQIYGNSGEGTSSGYQNTLEQGRREETVGNDDGSVALIDQLPKNKQRQIYGIVSGIEGGIQHLQRELDTLKKALGIDDED